MTNEILATKLPQNCNLIFFTGRTCCRKMRDQKVKVGLKVVEAHQLINLP